MPSGNRAKCSQGANTCAWRWRTGAAYLAKTFDLCCRLMTRQHFTSLLPGMPSLRPWKTFRSGYGLRYREQLSALAWADAPIGGSLCWPGWQISAWVTGGTAVLAPEHGPACIRNHCGESSNTSPRNARPAARAAKPAADNRGERTTESICRRADRTPFGTA